MKPSYPPQRGISLWGSNVICPLYLAGQPVNLWLKALSGELQQQIGVAGATRRQLE